eukprot:5977382-Pleurochrysis_carterae.AAC.1
MCGYTESYPMHLPALPVYVAPSGITGGGAGTGAGTGAGGYWYGGRYQDGGRYQPTGYSRTCAYFGEADGSDESDGSDHGSARLAGSGRLAGGGDSTVAPGSGRLAGRLAGIGSVQNTLTVVISLCVNVWKHMTSPYHLFAARLI